jgi:hypothetical protein
VFASVTNRRLIRFVACQVKTMRNNPVELPLQLQKQGIRLDCADGRISAPDNLISYGQQKEARGCLLEHWFSYAALLSVAGHRLDRKQIEEHNETRMTIDAARAGCQLLAVEFGDSHRQVEARNRT